MIFEKLKQDYSLLQKQLVWLDISTKQCKQISVKQEYTIEEFGNFETLCSRYSRSIDFLIRKIFRTLIDVVHNAHKRELFRDIQTLRLMKDLRNTIVHKYIEDALMNVFEEVLEYSEILIEMMNTTLEYINTIIKNKHAIR